MTDRDRASIKECLNLRSVVWVYIFLPWSYAAMNINKILCPQSLFYEILAGVWVRNGLQIKGQAMTYIQANFCNSMVDMDIYWLQVCAAHLPADKFLDMCIDM